VRAASPKVAAFFFVFAISPLILVACQAIVGNSIPKVSCDPDRSGCPSGTSCDPDTLTCLALSTEATDDIGTPDSQPSKKKDSSAADSSTDAATAKKPLGSVCLGDSECETGAFCGDSAVLTDKYTKNADPSGPKCTKPCCTSEDCPDSMICIGTGTGGSYCVAPNATSRPKLGTESGGSSCAAGSECRSGLCLGGKCADTCCRSAQCAAGSKCTVMPVDTISVFACGTAGAIADKGSCNESEPFECSSGQCINGSCRPKCCGRANAMSLGFEYCKIGPYLSGTDLVNSAMGPFKTPTGEFGTTCGADDDCKSHVCDNTKKCSDICCVDDDCPTGYVCRPLSGASGRPLVCAPAPK